MDRYTGTILKDRFVLEDMLGSGGMAIVYRATDKVTGNTVAVKILKEEFVADEQFRRRFLNESRAISMLRHRNIVSVIDFDFEGNLQYIVMEYIDGITLKDFLRSQKVIPPAIAVKITMQMLSALQHAHERGVIHRDIKPQNIMILNDGTIKVMDFGIARINKFETVTMTDKAIGTVYYISPEQARGEHTDERSDIYSVGVMLYEMITGELPFDGDTPVSVALKQIQTPAKRPRQLNKAIPIGLEQIVVRAMLKIPDKRFASAIDMINDLKQVLLDPNVTFQYDLKDELPKKNDAFFNNNGEKIAKPKFWTKGNIIAMAAGVVAALAVIVLIIWLLSGGGSGAESSSSAVTQVDVPNLVGKVYLDIMEDSEITGNFTISEIYEFSEDYEDGYIFEQSLEVGTKVDVGTEIIVKVSKGIDSIPVPDITGVSEDEAIATLDAQGIENYEIIRQTSSEVSEGLVIKTNPSANSEMGKDDTLFVYVSSGEDIVKSVVPRCIGKTRTEATFMLTSVNLVATFMEEYSSEVPAGYVIAQSITPDTEVDAQSTVLLMISKGPQPSSSSESSSSSSSSESSSSSSSSESSSSSSESSSVAP